MHCSSGFKIFKLHFCQIDNAMYSFVSNFRGREGGESGKLKVFGKKTIKFT